MFKKTEESEWTRFSRALGNRDEQREAEPTADMSEIDPAENQPTMVAPPPPAPASVPSAPVSVQPASPVAPPLVQAEPPPTSSAKPAALSVSETMLQEDVPQDSEDVESTIGDGTVIEGSVRSHHSIRILGSVQGEIEGKGNVTIETEATVNAKVTAENITIKGVVNGELTCPGRIEITDTGRLIGGINGGILVMHDGAYFEGTLKMTARRGQREPEPDHAGETDRGRNAPPLTEDPL